MPQASPDQFRPDPPEGRVFSASRLVRSADVTPTGRFRLDALARYLQDVAEDDVADTGWRAPYGWLLRRMTVTARGYPRFGDTLRLRTFCTGTGPRWAERTTTVAGPGGDLIQATAVWVAADLGTGRPRPLDEEFLRIYGPATQGRQVSARLSLPGPETALPRPAGPGRAGTGPAPGGVTEAAGARDWPVRAADFDTAGHVNNSVHWAALEDVLNGLDWLPAGAELEYHRPILPGSRPSLLTSDVTADSVYAWLLDGSGRLATGRLDR
jgi:acyl-ACP thioesterase